MALMSAVQQVDRPLPQQSGPPATKDNKRDVDLCPQECGECSFCVSSLRELLSSTDDDGISTEQYVVYESLFMPDNADAIAAVQAAALPAQDMPSDLEIMPRDDGSLPYC